MKNVTNLLIIYVTISTMNFKKFQYYMMVTSSLSAYFCLKSAGFTQRYHPKQIKITKTFCVRECSQFKCTLLPEKLVGGSSKIFKRPSFFPQNFHRPPFFGVEIFRAPLEKICLKHHYNKAYLFFHTLNLALKFPKIPAFF